MASTFLVTGGAGYIGSNVIGLLRARGDRAIAYDDLSSGRRERVSHLGAELIEGDVRDEARLRGALRGVDGVLHFAARKQVGESNEQPLLYYDVNVAGTRAVLSAMVATGVRPLVFSSSAAVYGDGAEGLVPESAPTRPLNPYGETKLAGEWLARAAVRAHGLRATLLRYFNVAGAPDDPLLADHDCLNLVPIALRAARRGSPLPVFGRAYPTRDGTGVRDYVHVSDLADAHVFAMDRLLAGQEGDTYNVGTGRGASVLEIAEAVRRATGLPLAVDFVPAREGDAAEVIADVGRIQAVLGWRARRTTLFDFVGSASRAGAGA